jgi:CHAT domain-containing protein
VGSFADFDVLHFAAHSDANNAYPWRSSIHLCGYEDTVRGVTSRTNASESSREWVRPGEEVTTLYASEIAGWKLPVRLVVLSSCQSAGGRILSGEGVQGLTSAFLSAGARSVVATLWPVDDLVTAEFMKDFYRSLADGSSVSASLREAQLSLARNPATADPFYWSGFVLVGDAGLRVELARRQGFAWPWVLTAGFLLVAVIIWILLSKKGALATVIPTAQLRPKR